MKRSNTKSYREAYEKAFMKKRKPSKLWLRLVGWGNNEKGD